MTKRKKIYKIISALALFSIFASVFALSSSALSSSDTVPASDIIQLGMGTVNTVFRVPQGGSFVLRDERNTPFGPDSCISGSTEFSILNNFSDLRMDSSYGDKPLWSRSCTWSFVPYKTVFAAGSRIKFSFGISYAHLNRSDLDFNAVSVAFRYRAFNDTSSDPIRSVTVLNNASYTINDTLYNYYTIEYTVPDTGFALWYIDITLSRQSGGLCYLPVQNGVVYWRLGIGSVTLNNYLSSVSVPDNNSEANNVLDDYDYWNHFIDSSADDVYYRRGFRDRFHFIDDVLDPTKFDRDVSFRESFEVWGIIFSHVFSFLHFDLVFYAFLALGAGFIFFNIVPTVIGGIKSRISRRR